MITLRRIVISLLLGVAVAGMYYAFTRPTDNQQPALKPKEVLHVEPAPADRVLRQVTIAVDLEATYTGVLTVDGIRIPEDQLDRIVGLNRVAFTPADGKEITKLRSGRICATAEFWQTTIPDAPHFTFPWCFEVH